MTQVEFMEGINLIQDNYNKTLTDSQLRLFYKELKDMNKEKYIGNIKEHIRTSPFLPNIAQIRNKKIFVNFEQRSYEGIDWDRILTNT